MVMLAAPAKQCQEDAFLSLFPHRFDYLYAPHPEPGTSPAWQTETRHPLTDRLLQQGSYLHGVRFGKQTQYCLLDIDKGSPYHPATDPFAIQRITAALETVGLNRYLICTSSYSGGLHLYFPFQSLQNTWELGAAITALLENAGLTVKPGLLEVFPNRKSYSAQGTSLFNGHRLPLQAGSYLLNQDFEPVWSNRNYFVQQWRAVQKQNEILLGTLKRILKQQRQKYQISGKATKFLNDLNTEIELGWNDHGQTNYLLGRIALRTYVFHHILENSPPLVGQALVDQIVTIARSLPGYEQWCRHQHELEHRASEWAICVENSRYFHYGYSKQQLCKASRLENSPAETPSLSWNQQQSQAARDRIRQAIANLLDQNALPAQSSARFKLLTAAGIGGGSLYRHKDLWHPDFLNSDFLSSEASSLDFSKLEIPDLNISNLNLSNLTLEELDLASNLNQLEPEPSPDSSIQPNFTNLFPSIGGNVFQHPGYSDLKLELFQKIGSNVFSNRALQLFETLGEFDAGCNGWFNAQFDEQIDPLFQVGLMRADSLGDIELFQLPRLNLLRLFKPP
jgi:hypothetical protein